MPAVKVANYAFENEGDLNFVKRNQEWFDHTPSYSYGAAFADLDGDGDLDYVVNNLNDEHFLSRGYTSSVDPVVHFGLSAYVMVDSIRVTWQAGDHISHLRNIEANQLVEIDERDAIPSHMDSQSQEDTEYPFSRLEGVISYDHQQDDFIDFFYSQSIIPHKVSQIGPCMQKGDLNNDGLEDIIVGATNTLPTRVFLRDSNRFVETEIEGLSTRKGFSESDFAIVDVDQDGDNDVIALAGGYENEEEKYIHYLYKNTNGSFSRTALPTSSFPAAVVKASDFDHDGDMDLFIGARIGLEIFPFAANSWLLINDNGTFKPENTLNFYLGMVTDAIWSDYDGDGWDDLLITREWNSIAAGDFDLDGDNDYIIGNLGENHRFTVSDQYPMRIYALDMDLNGTLDPISTGYWKDPNEVMREFPIHYFDDLMVQSPYFLKNLDDYTSFSYATINEILDSTMMKRVDYTLHTNTSSSYILWNHRDKFEWEKLPDMAQVSPIKKMVVHDFNNDNYPDVLLAGNDHTHDISTGYYDANKGILLLSKNQRPLNDLRSPSQTGLMLHGMVESLLFMEGDTPLIVAGFNRDKASVFSVTNSIEN